jgi:hypothetical protein
MDRPRKLKTAWISDLRDPSEKEIFTQQVLASKKVLDKLHKIVYNKVLDGEKVSVVDYDSPSWSHKQADQNGYLRGLREVLELLNFGDHDQ